jgi:hypothetical protein
MRMLSDLRRLRSQGKAPILPVFVTDNHIFAANMTSIGAFVVRPHDADWRPLSGLEVILCFRQPDDFRDLAMSIRAARPRRLRSLHSGGLSVIL